MVRHSTNCTAEIKLMAVGRGALNGLSEKHKEEMGQVGNRSFGNQGCESLMGDQEVRLKVTSWWVWCWTPSADLFNQADVEDMEGAPKAEGACIVQDDGPS